jgi:hypothetical protein
MTNDIERLEVEGAVDLMLSIENRGVGIRTELIASYEVPRQMYKHLRKFSAVTRMSSLGLTIWYADHCGYTGRRKRTPMDVDALVAKWHKVVSGLALAHDRDEADRYEASIDECLTPILSAPIKQVREFYPKLLASLKADKAIPFLVWRAYEVWVDQVLAKAPDEGIKRLKTDLARQIADMVEGDVKEQLPEAIIRALQWRDAETLAEVKETVESEKAAGHKVRLKGRESCLFLEAGGTEDEPKVCVQI